MEPTNVDSRATDRQNCIVDLRPRKTARKLKILLIMSVCLMFPHRLFDSDYKMTHVWYALNEHLSWNVRHAESTAAATISLLPRIKKTCFAAAATLLIVVLRLLESASRGSWLFVDTAAKCCRGPHLAICPASVSNTGRLRYVPSCLVWMETSPWILIKPATLMFLRWLLHPLSRPPVKWMQFYEHFHREGKTTLL